MKRAYLPALLVAGWLIAAAGCTPMTVQQVGARDSRDLLIYGGPGHDVFLGCLTCSRVAPESVFNPTGPHGGELSPVSIHYKNGEYGSRHSMYSACNPYASEPPVIVDGHGKSYGRLTANRFHSDISRDQDMLRWLEDEVCK